MWLGPPGTRGAPLVEGGTGCGEDGARLAQLRVATPEPQPRASVHGVLHHHTLSLLHVVRRSVVMCGVHCSVGQARHPYRPEGAVKSYGVPVADDALGSAHCMPYQHSTAQHTASTTDHHHHHYHHHHHHHKQQQDDSRQHACHGAATTAYVPSSWRCGNWWGQRVCAHAKWVLRASDHPPHLPLGAVGCGGACRTQTAAGCAPTQTLAGQRHETDRACVLLPPPTTCGSPSLAFPGAQRKEEKTCTRARSVRTSNEARGNTHRLQLCHLLLHHGLF